MAIEKIHIGDFLRLSKQCLLIDVRSPGEYNHAHIPGAFNLPLFNDEERAIVGTAYKKESREAAIRIGLDFFGPKMKLMVEEVEHLRIDEANVQRSLFNSKTIFIYCWRGGMRSAAMAWLFDLYGFKIYTLSGGYKKFRNHILEIFKHPFPLKILGGFTGAGKTGVLRELEKNGEHIIDLEHLANHKGSAFGNIGLLTQPSQEMFENLLGTELQLKAEFNNLTPNSYTWVEDESQRIGLVNIPKDFWDTMRKSPVYFLEISFEERLKHIVKEYGCLDKQSMIDAIIRIKERLGGLEARNAIHFLENDKIEDSFRILLKYYDKWYLKGLHNREGLNSLLFTTNCESVSPKNAKKLIQQPEYHEKL